METCNNIGKIKSVIPGNTLITPIMVKVDNRSLTADELVNYKCSWKKTDSDSADCTVSFSNHEKDSYEGTTNLQGGLSKTMLLLQNKETNKIQLIEVNQCNLGTVFGKGSSQLKNGNEKEGKTYEENRDRLLKAFGGKKGKRLTQISSAMKINSEIMSTNIKETAADVSVNLTEIVRADIVVDDCMPPIHRDATQPDGVFLLEDFITERELESMEDEAFAMYHLEPFTEEESGSLQFLIDAMHKLQNKLSIEKIKHLLYIDAMMKLVNSPDRNLRKKDLHERICPFSRLIAKKLTDTFTVEINQQRHRSVSMEDKLLTHIVAMIIITCESVNILELSKSIPNFSVKKMGLIMRMLSLSTRDKATWFVKLPLPTQRGLLIRRKKNLI